MKRSNPNRLGSTTVENEDEEPARRVPRLSYQHQAPTDILSMTAQQSLERIRHLQQPCMVELRAAMDAVFNEMDEMNAATEREIDELQTTHELYQSYEIRRQHIVAAPQELVTLNVGGVLHQFSKSLLEKYPDSYLAELVRRAIASRSTREAAMTSAAGKGGAAKTRSLLETALEKSAETCEGTSLLPYSNEGGATGEGSSGTQHSPECDQDQEEIVAFDELCCDRNGYVHVDRNGEIFGTILNFLRGYKPQLLSTDDADMILCDLKYYGLNSLYNAIRERVYPSGTHLFEYGGGVTYERTRFRSAYCVGLIGDRPLMQGKHEITFLIKQCEYVGIGVVSDVCVCLDQEFHKTPNCCVYYMTGVFYANFPHHKKEEGLEKYTRNDTVTVVLDMDDHYITFKKNQKVVRVVPCNTATFLRFAVVMKLDSEVLILSSTQPSETVLEVVDSSHEHARTELTPAGGERTARAPRVNQSTRRDSRSSLENLSGSTTSIRDDGYTIIRHAIGVAVDLSTTNMVDEQRVHQLIEDEEDNDDEDEIPEDDGTDTASLGLDF